MYSLHASPLLLNPLSSTSSSSSSSSSSLNRIKCNLNFPKLPRVSLFSVPKASMVDEIHSLTDITTPSQILHVNNSTTYSKVDMTSSSSSTIKLYAILEAVVDRIEMHNNIGEQRDNWNKLLLNSINMITLTASTMSGVATIITDSSNSDAPLLALKLSSALLFSAATGILIIMNKIQPSQLAEEQRNATRLFKNLQVQIQAKIAMGNHDEGDVRDAIEKVLALDKAYPLPLLGGAMIEKFPSKFEPSKWWPSRRKMSFSDEFQTDFRRVECANINDNNDNGWSVELENEMREVIEVVKRKDVEDYERLGNIALKVNKILSISGPLLTGIAAIGSLAGSTMVPVLAGSLATIIDSLQHGGQVGMVLEMYRNCGGFFELLEETVEGSIDEKELNRRENGELFELKMALKLGRSVSQLRELASKSASCRLQGREIDEFASKLF